MTTKRPRPPPMVEGSKLHGNNWVLWKLKMKETLDSFDLLNMMLGTDLKPQATIDAVTRNTILVDPSLPAAWRCRHADAFYALIGSIADSVLTMVQHLTAPSEVWVELQAQYETTNPTTKLNLENQLQAVKLGEGETAQQFLTRIKDIRDQMATIGMPISTEDLARRCVRALPSKYDSLVTSLNTGVCPSPLTFKEFSSILME